MEVRAARSACRRAGVGLSSITVVFYYFDKKLCSVVKLAAYVRFFAKENAQQ